MHTLHFLQFYAKCENCNPLKKDDVSNFILDSDGVSILLYSSEEPDLTAHNRPVQGSSP